MIGPTDLLHPSPAPHFKTFQVFLICCPKRPSFSTLQSHVPNVAFYWFLRHLKTLNLVLLVSHLPHKIPRHHAVSTEFRILQIMCEFGVIYVTFITSLMKPWQVIKNSLAVYTISITITYSVLCSLRNERWWRVTKRNGSTSKRWIAYVWLMDF